MATSKQPPFPDPPLEVGIAQYPTPNVPDYYTRDGHIILVEKVSIEKGNYNPQPLDGSVIYDKRDANDWPENLYLVFQQTEPTGKFVFNYWANDRTLASQDPWNYGIQYSEENPTYPIYTRTYIVPRSQYAPVAEGSVDPVFGGSSVIVKQQMAELEESNPLRSRYVQVQRVYEKIPGPVLTGKQYDADLGLVVTNTKQVVSSSASPYSVTNGTLAYRDEPIDSNKSARIISSISSLPATRMEYKTGAYASPNLLYGFNSSVFNFPDGQIQYNVTPVMRAKRSYQTVFKHETSFQYGQPSQPADTLFDPVSIHVIYDGFFFKIDIPDCLTDPGLSITFFTGINTPAAAYYGSINETYNIPASSTPASTGANNYLSKVGTYQLIAYEIDYWKANIWRVSKQSVLIK
jgi:hypothetical protein